MKYVTFFLIGVFALAGCKQKIYRSFFSIIPEPQQLIYTGEKVNLADTLGKIQIFIKPNLQDLGSEGYELRINPDGVVINAPSDAGVFYARQTLDQLLTAESIADRTKIQGVTIRDWPAFAWRGGMLDVSRHFFPKEFILKYLDILAFHKLNHFHWHLTDGTAWRLELDAYPELTDSVDSYSKADVREIIAYAASRHITVIPEIEMPGHSDAALLIHPELSCNPDHPVGVYCAGKEETFEFLETVLTEVMDLFPSDLIHVGGDEVGKGAWKACDLCQQRIKEEGLADEDELQSYFIKRIAGFLDKNGKQLIGWDEILEGGLAESAKVMSWRGMKGGMEAAEMGHDVVMSPGYPCYFDHYQSAHEAEPQAWGGLNGIKDVYGFDPVPRDIPKDKRKHILGGQANLWTEQVATPAHAEYMMMPRYSALGEVLWSGPDNTNWERFEQKMITQLNRYEGLGYHFAKSALIPRLETELLKNGHLKVSLSRELDLFDLRYTLDGSEPTTESLLYDQPLELRAGDMLKAQTFRDGQAFSWLTVLEDLPNLATGKRVSYVNQWEESYPGIREKTLTDAQLASKRGDDPHWQGFKTVDLDITVDLEKIQPVSRVWIRFFQHAGMTRVMLPKEVEVSGSGDGTDYTVLGVLTIPTILNPEAVIEKVNIRFNPEEVRFIRIRAVNHQIIPEGHSYHGLDAWIFADEIGVE